MAEALRILRSYQRRVSLLVVWTWLVERFAMKDPSGNLPGVGYPNLNLLDSIVIAIILRCGLITFVDVFVFCLLHAYDIVPRSLLIIVE